MLSYCSSVHPRPGETGGQTCQEQAEGVNVKAEQGAFFGSQRQLKRRRHVPARKRGVLELHCSAKNNNPDTRETSSNAQWHSTGTINSSAGRLKRPDSCPKNNDVTAEAENVSAIKTLKKPTRNNKRTSLNLKMLSKSRTRSRSSRRR